MNSVAVGGCAGLKSVRNLGSCAVVKTGFVITRKRVNFQLCKPVLVSPVGLQFSGNAPPSARADTRQAVAVVQLQLQHPASSIPRTTRITIRT